MGEHIFGLIRKVSKPTVKKKSHNGFGVFRPHAIAVKFFGQLEAKTLISHDPLPKSTLRGN